MRKKKPNAYCRTPDEIIRKHLNFFEELRKSGVISKAARAAGISVTSGRYLCRRVGYKP